MMSGNEDCREGLFLIELAQFSGTTEKWRKPFKNKCQFFLFLTLLFRCKLQETVASSHLSVRKEALEL